MSLLEESDVTDYSFSYYDYINTDGCSGFGIDFANSSEDDIQRYFLNSPVTVATTLFLLPVVAAVGTLGNAAFVFIVWKVPAMRNGMNLILLNLAVADLVYLVVGSSEKILNVASSPVNGDKYVGGEVGQCWIVTPLLELVSFASLLLVSSLSVERYLAICRPLTHLRISGRRRTIGCVGLVWAVSFAITAAISPAHVELVTICLVWPNDPRYEDFPAVLGECLSEENDAWVSVSEAVQLIPFFLALVLNAVCFAKIIAKLRRRLPPAAAASRSTKNDLEMTKLQRRSANAATRMLLVNGVAFFLLTTPYHVTNAIQFFEITFPQFTHSLDFEGFKTISIVLLYVNSAVNPFIYGMLNPAYRKAYRRLICRDNPRSSFKLTLSTETSRSHNASADTTL